MARRIAGDEEEMKGSGWLCDVIKKGTVGTRTGKGWGRGYTAIRLAAACAADRGCCAGRPAALSEASGTEVIFR